MENKAILLVEDDPRDEALTLRALRRCNIANEVVVARDGIEALDYLFATGKYSGRNTGVMPQFILLDLKLPGMDGLQVLKRIRTSPRTKRIPVVVFTSSRKEEVLLKSYDLGANSFVRKPVDLEQFMEAVRQLGLYWLILNQVVKVLIADDHEVVRDGIKRILGEQWGAVTFGEAGAARDALKLAREKDWDVAVIDLSLGDRNGIEVLKEMKKSRPQLPVLIFSEHSGKHYAHRAFKAGASGFITKDSPRQEFARAVNKVMKGGRYISAALAEKLAVDLERAADQLPHEQLSGRELEVLLQIASGKTVGEIAKLLGLSNRTVSTYRARVLEKMGMKTNADLTRYAIQNRLVD